MIRGQGQPIVFFMVGWPTTGSGVRSSSSFPRTMRRDDVKRLTVRTLMLSGENSYPLGKLIDAELERVLPNEQRVIVPEATHETCNEQPAFCVQAIRAFLAKR